MGGRLDEAAFEVRPFPFDFMHAIVVQRVIEHRRALVQLVTRALRVKENVNERRKRRLRTVLKTKREEISTEKGYR